MSITAKRGEYRIGVEASARAVASHQRSHGVTFSPSASGSRFGLTDSGLRYEVRLRDGSVEIRAGNSRWEALRAALDPDTGRRPPWGVCYLGKREGAPLRPVPFDMIAVGRGRVLAKEKDTDRIFHVQLDELFRTRPPAREPALPGRPEAEGDPVVPANYAKLDPEFFTPATGEAFPVPPAFEEDYAAHPASLRFPLFVETMKAETSDGMMVPVKSRVWELIDARPPLVIFDLDDLKCIGDAELRQVATRDRLRRIIEEIYRGKKSEIEKGIREEIRRRVDFGPPPNLPISTALRALVSDFGEIFDKIGDIAGSIGGVPYFGDQALALANLMRGGQQATALLPREFAREVEDFVEQRLADAAIAISQGLLPFLIDAIAGEGRAAIAKDGFASLFYPGIIALSLVARGLQDKGALKIVPPSGAGARDADCARRSELRLHIGKTVKALLQDQDSPSLRQLIQALVEAGRRKRGVTIPNAPPDGLPTYLHVRYERATREAGDAAEVHERRSIAFRRVLDLGIGYSHWHEHWQANYGGEMHNLLATRPIFQQERYNLIQYRFLNGPVIDGDGYNDGTTNFYMLVELEDPKPPAIPPGRPVKGRPKGAKPVEPAGRYAILWIDEQSYFSQRWRLLHPTIDTAGDLFSIQRSLRDNPEYFRFDPACYWSPFDEGCIHGSSRMAVIRQIVAVTGGRPDGGGTPEIYTICFNYGVCDHSWRWRPMPPAPDYRILDQALAGGAGPLPDDGKECLYANTLGLREDATLHLRGFKRAGGGRIVEGRWVQKYLPADLRHVPERFELAPGARPARGFDHPWDFISERAYQRADHFYHFGAYERSADARCQYYEIDLLPDARGVVRTIPGLARIVWRNERIAESAPPPLRIDTVNFNWALPRDEDGYLELNKLTADRGRSRSMSMYETTTRFRLLERKGKGVIAVLFDKRDDELQPASHLPHETVLIEDLAFRSPTSLIGGGARRLRVRFRANRRVLNPPMVQRALIERVQAGGVTTGLRLSFWTHQSDDQVRENLWRFSLAALDDPEDPVTIARGEVFSRFVRQGLPDRPLPLNFTSADVATPEYQYLSYQTGLDPATIGLVDRYCTPQGRVDYATSLWFEDVVGHLSTPERLEFGVGQDS